MDVRAQALRESMSPIMIGRTIQRLRKAAGLTQPQLAKKAGLSRSTIATAEGGRYGRPDTSTLIAVARVLGVTVDTLTGPEVGSAKTREIMGAFRASPWWAALRPTEDEIQWLEGLPDLVWADKAPTAETMARLLSWRREK